MKPNQDVKNTKSEPAQTEDKCASCGVLRFNHSLQSREHAFVEPAQTAGNAAPIDQCVRTIIEDVKSGIDAAWLENRTKARILSIVGLYKTSAASSQEAATPQDYKALVELAARVLLQHMNDEDYEMSLAGLYAKLTEKYPLEVADHAPTPEPTGLFNWYTSLHRGFIFSKRMRIVEAMTAAMYAAEQSVAEPAPSPATKETSPITHCPTCMSPYKNARLKVVYPEWRGGKITTRTLMESCNHSWHDSLATASSQGPAREETIIDLAKKMSAAGYCNVGACKEYLQSAFDAGAKSVVAAPQLENRSDKDYAIEHGEYLAKAATEFLKVSNERAKIGEESDSMEDLMNADEVLADHRGTLESAVYEFRKRAKRALAGAAALPSAPIKFPTHKCGLFLTHNEHRDYYEKLADYLTDRDYADTFESPEAMQRAVATDEHWHLQWYPDTPVGFYEVSAPTLEEVVRLASEGKLPSPPVPSKEGE